MKETEDRDWVKQLLKEGKKVYFLSGDFKDDIKLIRKIFKNENIKIIHGHFLGAKDYIFLKLAMRLDYNKIKLITHGHNHFNKNQNIVLNCIKNIIYKSDLYIGCSQSVSNSYIDAGINEKKVKTITNAIEFQRLDKFEKLDKDEIGISDSRTILMFGFDYYRKGVDLVIRALTDIYEQFNIKLLISISSNKDIVINEIKKIFGEVPNWIIILEARDDVSSYYKISDVFISASREEGFCYALVEAAYCGCSIILSDIPGQNSLDIPYAARYDLNNLDEMKMNIIEKLLLNKDKAQEESKLNKLNVEKVYNINTWAINILEEYNNLLNI